MADVPASSPQSEQTPDPAIIMPRIREIILRLLDIHAAMVRDGYTHASGKELEDTRDDLARLTRTTVREQTPTTAEEHGKKWLHIWNQLQEARSEIARLREQQPKTTDAPLPCPFCGDQKFTVGTTASSPEPEKERE